MVGLGAGSIAIVFVTSNSVGSYGMGIGSNHQAFFKTLITNSLGGMYNSPQTFNHGGGAGALLISFNTYSVGTVGDYFVSNTQLFYDCSISNNIGGSFNNLGSDGTGAAGLLVMYFSFTAAITYSKNYFIAKNSIFSNNHGGVQNGPSAIDAGGVLIYYQSIAAFNNIANSITFIDCVWLNNTSDQSGGVSIVGSTGVNAFEIKFNDCDFTNNAAVCPPNSGACSGGAIGLFSLSANMFNVSFQYNNAVRGGAINLGTGARLICVGCTFEFNSASLANDINVPTDAVLVLQNSFVSMASPDDEGNPSVSISGLLGLITINNNTFLVCNPGEFVVRFHIFYGCQKCTPGTYSLTHGIWVDYGIGSSGCLICPFGADCTLGGQQVRSLIGFLGEIPHGFSLDYNGYDTYQCQQYGSIVDSKVLSNSILYPCLPLSYARSSSSSILMHEISSSLPNINISLVFTACPSQYCCYQEVATNGICESYHVCAPHRLGRLCSECEEGFSQAVDSSSCIDSNDCNDSLWFITLCFGIGFLFSLYIVYGAINLTRNQSDINIINLAAYFVQMASVMSVVLQREANSSSLTVAQRFFFQILSLQPTSSVVSTVCLAPGITALQVQMFLLFSPVFIVIPFLLIIAFIYFIRDNKLCEISILNSVSVSVISRVGMVRIGLFTFTSVVTNVFNMLNCVEINGLDGLYVFQAAYTRCYQIWQIGMFILLIPLGALPLFIVFKVHRMEKSFLSSIQFATNSGGANSTIAHSSTIFKSRYHMGGQQVNLKNTNKFGTKRNNNMISRPGISSGTNSDSESKKLNPVSISDSALICVLCMPYTKQCRYWEAILLSQRCICAVITTFSLNAPITFVVLSGVNLMFLCLHLWMCPFTRSIMQHLQTLFGIALIGMTLLPLSSATLFSNASGLTSTFSPTIDILADCSVAVLLIPLFVAIVVRIILLSPLSYLLLQTKPSIQKKGNAAKIKRTQKKVDSTIQLVSVNENGNDIDSELKSPQTRNINGENANFIVNSNNDTYDGRDSILNSTPIVHINQLQSSSPLNNINSANSQSKSASDNIVFPFSDATLNHGRNISIDSTYSHNINESIPPHIISHIHDKNLKPSDFVARLREKQQKNQYGDRLTKK
jgi:hypothetical protein